ncbi:OmpA family protein [Flavobacteriaceae bacterium D16]|nr:OmpA family protein [Flavobacteriaceae bacterium D16]
MKTYIFSAIALLSVVLQTRSQEIPEITTKDSIIVNSWMFGVGWNFIDDSGDAFNDVTTIKDQWNGVAFPSRLSLGRYWKNGLGLELIGTYNNYKEGNKIDNVIITEDIPYWGIDARLSYDLNKLVGQTGFFDPYIGVGLGYSDANNLGRGTYNAVIGFRTWFSDRWGLDFSSSGKWSFGNEASNHIQHAVGAVYRFNIEKELSKKGEEKLALLQELEKEQQRIQDSILAVREAEEEARMLAERLEREKEAARLAALEAEEARKMGLLKLQQALDSIGTVYFAFDSSILSKDAKETLAEIASLMKANPKYTFKVEAHADSRGPKQYNQWLSERRAQRTVDYLNTEGISMDRLEAIGYGEERLINHCAEGVSCNREEHRMNRRSEIAIKVVDRELVSVK